MSRAGAEAACPLWLGEGRVCSRADLLTLADHGTAGVAHRASASQILFPVDADVRSRWHDDVLVDDGVPDSGVATDLDEVEQDAVRDGRVAVDVNNGGEH